MSDFAYLYGSQPNSGRVDSFAAFDDESSGMSFDPMKAGLDDFPQSKFSFRPPQTQSASFDPVSAGAYTHSLPMATVHPQALFEQEPRPPAARELDDSDTFFSPSNLITDFGNSRQQYGQVTPPDDFSPKSAHAMASFSLAAGAEAVLRDGDAETQPDNKRRRSSSKSTTSPRKRGRKNKKVAETDDVDPEEAVKREQFLERNRVAAHKCRQKKKEWMVNLDEQARDLQAHNRLLQAQVTNLSDELYGLKNLMFQHSNCGFTPIESFIEREAQKVRARVHPTKESVMAAAPPDAAFAAVAQGFGSGTPSGRSRSATAESDTLRNYTLFE